MTREVAAALTAFGIDLHDHVVVARGGYASFKAMGLV
ncbi:MAG: JAB domain-containing protein [Pseudomonadota bacterium]|nr:JAB domain-containing protein [Pseudomonadota bacterium]